MISGVIPARLSVVTLGAADLPSLRRFYLSMGWQERPDSDDGFASFLLGGVLLALYRTWRHALLGPGTASPWR